MNPAFVLWASVVASHSCTENFHGSNLAAEYFIGGWMMHGVVSVLGEH